MGYNRIAVHVIIPNKKKLSIGDTSRASRAVSHYTNIS